MSLQQVRRALPEAKFTTGRAARTARTSTEIARRPYAVALLFDPGGRLDAVELTPAAGADPSSGYEEVLAWLTAQHGLPSYRADHVKPSGSWTRASSWTSEARKVHLRAWNTMLDDARVLQLDLGSGDVRPAPYGLRVTYEPPRRRPPSPGRAASNR